MRTFDEVAKMAAEKYTEGCAVFDRKYNEVFRFSFQTDAQVVVEWPDMFRHATEKEGKLLQDSGKNYVVLG